jgi:signal transduction histidine kinase
MALAKNISIMNEVEDDLIIWADKNSMMTVFRNLINNAIKFSHKDNTIEVLATKVNNEIVVKVKDYGVGIPEEKLRDIFKLKGDKSTWGTAKEKGVGLGLSLAYDFVKMNKGEILVESKVDKGTTFVVKLPVYVDTEIS